MSDDTGFDLHTLLADSRLGVLATIKAIVSGRRVLLALDVEKVYGAKIR